MRWTRAIVAGVLVTASTLAVTATPVAAASSLTVSGPVTGGNGAPAGLTTAFDLSQVGYQQSEFFVSGTAKAYAPTAPLTSDGRWSVAPGSAAAYTTRILVNRPSDPQRFNGTVYVEWLNVTLGSDVAVDWGFGHNELIRRGAAWVGVSAQAVGLNADKAADPVRYAALSHPGDSYSYDMFSQAGEAIRSHAATVLGGLVPKRLIADGESQSAGRLVTYIDAVHPLAQVYDGFLVHSRGATGAPLSQSPLPPHPAPAPTKLRTDTTTPVLVLQSETDVNEGARQDDSPTFRLWEMAGTSHVDAYTLGIGLTDNGDGRADVAMFEAMRNPPVAGCDLPINTGPSHWLVQSAMLRLHQWVKRGIAPPIAPRIEVTTFSPRTYARDTNGNVLGGIRTPHVDAPIATVTAARQGGPGLLCQLVGATIPFDGTKLSQLYASHDNFVHRWHRATKRAIKAGFLIGADGRRLNEAARASTVAPEPTRRLSGVGTNGTVAPGGSFGSDVSADGRFVAFTSLAALTPDDTNGLEDVYLHDRSTGTTVRVSADSDAPGLFAGINPAVSDNGQVVVYLGHRATATGPVEAVFVRDLGQGTLDRVSDDHAVACWQGGRQGPAISGDGTTIAFRCSGGVPGAPSEGQCFAENVLLRVRVTLSLCGISLGLDRAADVLVMRSDDGVVRILGLNNAAVEDLGQGEDPTISADGLTVAFARIGGDAYVLDRVTRVLERVSVSSTGGAADQASFAPAISPDGRFVAFESSATNLVADDTNAAMDVFLHDRTTGRTERVDVDPDGNGPPGVFGRTAVDAQVSADGAVVTFTALVPLLPADTNEIDDVYVSSSA
ncbi:MAG: alpha/beta hydrolase domain-containing protein [Acidimicrobiia bacterium]